MLVVSYLVGRMKPVQPDDDGGWTLRPGWVLNTLFWACTIFVILFSVALANITSRSDWREQIVPLILLIVGFGAGAVWTGWTAYGRVIKWNADQIVVQRRLGRTRSWPWSAIRSCTTNAFTAEYVIVFDDAEKLRIPTWMKGTTQLVQYLADRDIR
ncbi:hypothetical protein [Rhizorhabdus argentea]|uniref:hypothetical protein n=1 Tax=Rhizorhabdus argentea TaxID=1387174 RepID=UPI0030ECEA25